MIENGISDYRRCRVLYPLWSYGSKLSAGGYASFIPPQNPLHYGGWSTIFTLRCNVYWELTMGRPAYEITEKDYNTAYSYIKNGMTRDIISSSAGYMKFRNANTPEKLQAWCEDNLDADQWKNLKNTIWISRKRSKDYKTNKQKKQVDLDWLAWNRLSSAAKEEGLTLSQMIIAMEDVYYQAKAKGIKPTA